MSVAIRVSSNETKQLEAFVKNLGAHEKTDLYMYNDTAYINADSLFHLLSVDENWFKKNAESKIHYIMIKKKIHVNKYGIVKILSQSKEAAAFKLQDYIFEVIYKLETKGSVSITDIESRQELIQVLSELNLYKEAEDNNRAFLEDAQKSIDEMRADYAIVNEEIAKLKKEYGILELRYNKSNDRFKLLQDVSQKLAQYIKFKATQTTTTSKLICKWEELTELELHDNLDNELAMETVKKPKKSKIKELYLMQSSKPVGYNEHELYEWFITNSLPQLDGFLKYEDFKEFSEAYRMGGIESKYPHVWYNDLNMSNAQEKLFHTMLKHNSVMSEMAIIELSTGILQL